MNYEPRMRCWAVPAVAATVLALAGAPSHARDAKELMMKSIGTTENVSPVIIEAVKHAAMDLTPTQRKLALECWKNNVCEIGHGTLTVAYADGFGENVWRQVTKMEFIGAARTRAAAKRLSACRSGNGRMGHALRSTRPAPAPCVASEAGLRSTTSMRVTVIAAPDTQPIPRHMGIDGYSDRPTARYEMTQGLRKRRASVPFAC
jgi:hypothetical protein